MQHKVPVIGTAVGAVVFPFQNFLSILRIGWFPVLLAAILLFAALASMATGVAGLEAEFGTTSDYLIVPQYHMEAVLGFFDKLPLGAFELPDAIPGKAAALGGFTGTVLLLIAAPLALLPIQTVIYEVAGGRRDWPRGFLFFRFGMRELRLLFASYVLWVASAAFLLALVPPLALIFFIGASSLEPAVIVTVGIVVYAAFYIALIWFALRTSAIPAAVAAENRLILIEGFKATRGNAWRLLFSMIVLGLLYFVLMAVIGVVLIALGAVAGHEPESHPVVIGAVTAVLTGAGYIVLLTVSAAYVAMIWAAVRSNVMDDDDLPPAEAATNEALSGESELTEDLLSDGYETDAATDEPEAMTVRREAEPAQRQFADEAAVLRRDDVPEASAVRAAGPSIGFLRGRFR